MSVFKKSGNIKSFAKALQVCNLNHGIRRILSFYVTSKAAYFTAYIAVRRSLGTTYTAVDWSLLLRHYVS